MVKCLFCEKNVSRGVLYKGVAICIEDLTNLLFITVGRKVANIKELKYNKRS